MSEKNEYSLVEVAEMMKEKLQEVLKKSSNSSHEIDSGEEPNNDDAECPDYLANAGFEGGSSEESSEAFSSEDGESDETEKDESGKKKKKEDNEEDTEEETQEESEEDEEDKESKYDFTKSEACGHVIEYKTLRKEEKAKDNAEIKHTTEDAKKMSNAQNATFGSSIRSGKKGSMKGHKGDASPGQIEGERQAKLRREKIRSEESNMAQKKSEVKETKGIDFDKENTSDKGLEEKKGLKRPIEKCGDMLEAKSSSKLKKFLGKEKKPSPGMVQTNPETDKL